MEATEKDLNKNSKGTEDAALQQKQKSSRLVSLDTLRGFTMFWIVGGGALIASLQSLGDCKITDFLVHQLDHSPWVGLRYYDCIWPCFMLMVGVSIPFAYAKRSQTQSHSKLLWHAIIRFAVLFLLGSMRESVNLGTPHLVELSSALQPIAVAYLISFLLVRKSWKFQAIAGLTILFVYGIAVAFIPVPGIGSGSYARGANLVWFVDKILLPGRVGEDVFQEGWGTMISMIPPASTTILGLLMGRLLMSKESSGYKMKIMALTCIGVLATGYIVSIFVPVVMKMWTTSYGLISAGWACTMLFIFYWFIDVMGFKKWTIFFVVIGVNALAIYLSDTVMRLSAISDIFTRDLSNLMGSFGPLFAALVYIGIEWGILYWMYKRKIFLTP